MISSLTPLFRPGRIAVIGASSNPEKMGFQIFRNILEAGFSGDVLPVNPKGEVILGRSSVRSAGEIPEGTDLAVVIIPAKLVPATILQLGEGKVRSAIVITGGLAEAGGEGRTERGRKAAESHTRSLAGKDEIYDAVFRQYGVHRASTLEELYDFSKALAYLPPPPGPKTLIVTSSGGSAIIATY